MRSKCYIKLIFILLQILISSQVLAYKTTIHNFLQAPDDVYFFDEQGEKHFLEEYERDVVLLVFWATWSNSATKDLPDLDILQKDFRKLPFKIIAVSQDFQGVEVVKDFFKTYELRHLEIYLDYRNQLFKAFNVIGTPTSFLINQNGKIVMSFTGEVNWYDEEVRNIILNHIPGVNAQPKNSYKSRDLNDKVKNIKTKPSLNQKSLIMN